jgi:hypothetical protein
MTFDPYEQWLGIPPTDQPPTHYRLLGIDPHERDLEVITSAADRLSAHVRSVRTARELAVAQRVLKHILSAKDALLDPEQRAAYDKELFREALQTGGVPWDMLLPGPTLDESAFASSAMGEPFSDSAPPMSAKISLDLSEGSEDGSTSASSRTTSYSTNPLDNRAGSSASSSPPPRVAHPTRPQRVVVTAKKPSRRNLPADSFTVAMPPCSAPGSDPAVDAKGTESAQRGDWRRSTKIAGVISACVVLTMVLAYATIRLELSPAQSHESTGNPQPSFGQQNHDVATVDLSLPRTDSQPTLSIVRTEPAFGPVAGKEFTLFVQATDAEGKPCECSYRDGATFSFQPVTDNRIALKAPPVLLKVELFARDARGRTNYVVREFPVAEPAPPAATIAQQNESSVSRAKFPTPPSPTVRPAVSRAPPTLAIIRTEPSVPVAGQSFAIIIEAKDATGMALVYQYRINDAPYRYARNNRIEIPGTSAGVLRLVLNAVDDEGKQTSLERQFTVVDPARGMTARPDHPVVQKDILPIPSEAAQRIARSKIVTVGVTVTTPGQFRILAANLYQRAQLETDTDKKYVLLIDAHKAASRSRDNELARRIRRDLEARYDVSGAPGLAP